MQTQASEIAQKAKDLCREWPNHCQIVQNCQFRRKKNSNRVKKGRAVLVISTHGWSAADKINFQTSLANALLNTPTVSFPIKEKADHVLVRHKDKIYDNGYYYLNNPITDREVPFLRWHRFKISPYKISNSKRLEPYLLLQRNEYERLNTYLSRLEVNPSKVLGRYRHAGAQTGIGFLDNNKALGNEGHNCISWLSTAPLAKDNEALMHTLGASKSDIVGTSPSWWLPFLLSQTEDSRIPIVLFWSQLPLQQILLDVRENEDFPWDFGPAR